MGRSIEDLRTSLDVAAMVSVLDTAPVTIAVVYGSHARGDATHRSDIDIAVAFDESLTSIERTHARLALIARLSVTLGTDDVDVVPLSGITPALHETIHEEGIVVYGDSAEIENRHDTESDPTTHEDRLARFDDVLAALDRVV